MGVVNRHERIYVCDRCGDETVRVDAEVAPGTWGTVFRGRCLEVPEPWTRATALLCTTCNSWLSKFLQGCKVAE